MDCLVGKIALLHCMTTSPFTSCIPNKCLEYCVKTPLTVLNNKCSTHITADLVNISMALWLRHNLTKDCSHLLSSPAISMYGTLLGMHLFNSYYNMLTVQQL